MRATTKSGDPKAPVSKAPRPRPDGRRTLLVYLDGDLIKNLKKVALDDERNAYEIVEEAVVDWLARRSKKVRAKGGRGVAPRGDGRK